MRANDVTAENSFLFHFRSNFRANCLYRVNWSRETKRSTCLSYTWSLQPTRYKNPHVKPAQNYVYRRFFSLFFAVASHLLINERIKMSHGLRMREKCTRLLHALEWPNHALNKNWVSSVLSRHNSLATPRLKFTLESYSLQPVLSITILIMIMA